MCSRGGCGCRRTFSWRPFGMERGHRGPRAGGAGGHTRPAGRDHRCGHPASRRKPVGRNHVREAVRGPRRAGRPIVRCARDHDLDHRRLGRRHHRRTSAPSPCHSVQTAIASGRRGCRSGSRRRCADARLHQDDGRDQPRIHAGRSKLAELHGCELVGAIGPAGCFDRPTISPTCRADGSPS